MLIYLASPYSGPKKVMKLREELITMIAAILTKRYRAAFFLPITQSHRMSNACPGLFGTKFEAWQDIDYQAIANCDEVWVVKIRGWKESIGVQAEIKYANKLSIPVKYVNSNTLKITRV